MEKNIKVYTLSSLLFLCMLMLSSAVGGILQAVTKALSFILPFILAYSLSDEECRGEIPLARAKKSLSLLPFLPICLLFTFTLSLLTTLFIEAFSSGVPQNPLSGNVVFDVLYLGLMPAILEELFFRLLPIIIIAPVSKKTAILLSAIFFSLAHLSLFSIPYALFAGIIFITLDLMAESIWPSLILHLVNNILSVFYMYNAEKEGFTALFFIILGAVALVCAAVVIALRRRYLEMLSAALQKADKPAFPTLTLAYILPTLVVAALSLT